MVLRLLLAALVVANIGYFLWSRSAATESADREPQRLTQQIRPQLLEIRRQPTEGARPAASAPAPAPAAPASSPPAAAPEQAAPTSPP